MAWGYDIRQRLAAALTGRSPDGARDYWEIFGYPREVISQSMLAQYRRGGVAHRIIRAFPQATWRDRPVISDAEGNTDDPESKDYSKFVGSVWDLFDRLNVPSVMERVDRLSSIGWFGVVFLGFEGQDHSQPLDGRPRLSYVSAYGDPDVEVSLFDENPASPRYGLPVSYQLKRSSSVGTSTNVTVHHSRIIHVAEALDSDEVYSIPRLLPVYNHLLDLEKVVGSSAETYWLNARGGMQLKADKDVRLSPDDMTDLKKQAEEFENQLRRTLALRGVQAEMLKTEVHSPKDVVDSLLDLIAGTVGMPKRILIGSERGELASSQDEGNWAARIDERQDSFATPQIIKPFVQKMIDTGNVLAPQGGWFSVTWPKSASLSEGQRAEVAERLSRALSSYGNSPGAELVVPVAEFREHFLELPSQTEYVEPDEESLDESDPSVSGQFVAGDAQQDTALSGAQIEALRTLLESVGLGTMSPETAVQTILVGFPTVEEATARAIVDPMKNFVRDNAGSPPPDNALAANVRRAEIFVNRLRVNSEPRSLYVRRDVLNVEDIRAHFRAQGVEKMLPASDMHVTLMHSRQPVDWFSIEPMWNVDDAGRLVVPPGGARMMSLFGKESPRRFLVLQFSSAPLSWRHQDMLYGGCSWDWPQYEPHVSISSDVERSWGSVYSEWDGRLRDLEPWRGEIVLGPEIWEEVDEGWADRIVENQSA